MYAWVWAVSVGWAADVSVLGILKAPQQAGCAQAWLMPTDPSQPTPHCVDLSVLSPEQQETLRGFFDEELIITGSFVEGALGLRAVDTALGADNAALDYHIAPLPVSRSHDVGRRLADNDVGRLRVQTPPQATSVEFLFQGATTKENLPQVMEALTFSLRGQPLVPETRSFGQTIVLVIPELPPRQLLTISADGVALRELLATQLYAGEADKLSLTMLLSPL